MDNTDSNKSIKYITMLSSYIIIARVRLEHVTQMDLTRLIANDLSFDCRLHIIFQQIRKYIQTTTLLACSFGDCPKMLKS